MATDRLGRADTPVNSAVGGDQLGMSKYAKALATFVRQCETPMTVGIQGEWGTGKTSLMHMVEHRLSVEHQLATQTSIQQFFFNTWQYGVIGGDEWLGMHLLQDLVRYLQKLDEDDGKVAKLADGLLTAASAVMRAVAVGVANKTTGGLVDGDTLRAGLASVGSSAAVFDIKKVRESFADLVKRILDDKDSDRMVVFIDDLDRIRPAHAVTLLEVLKNFLDVERCVFVIACDYEVVRLGVEKKFGMLDEVKARAFFDKIIQVPFRMPVESYEMGNMLRDFLGSKLDKRQKEAIDSLTRRLAPIVSIATGSNPRAFKRFLNSVDLLASLEASGEDSKQSSVWTKEREKDLEALVALVALQVRWPEVAAHLGQLESAQDVEAAFATILSASGEEEAGVSEVTGPGMGAKTADEELWLALRNKYGARWSTEGVALQEFFQGLKGLLDSDENERLDENELKPFLGWIHKIGLTNTTAETGKGWQKFKQEAREDQEHQKQADATLRLLEYIHRFRRTHLKRTEIRRLPSYFIMLLRHGEKMPTVLSVTKDLKLRFNGSPLIAQENELPTLEHAAARLHDEVAKLGIKWNKTGKGSLLLDLKKLDPSQIALLKEPICKALQEVDGTVRAAMRTGEAMAPSVVGAAVE